MQIPNPFTSCNMDFRNLGNLEIRRNHTRWPCLESLTLAITISMLMLRTIHLHDIWRGDRMCSGDTHMWPHAFHSTHSHHCGTFHTPTSTHTHTSIQREREAHKHIHTYKTHTQRKYTALDRLKTSWLQDSSTIRFSSVCCIPVW